MIAASQAEESGPPRHTTRNLVHSHTSVTKHVERCNAHLLGFVTQSVVCAFVGVVLRCVLMPGSRNVLNVDRSGKNVHGTRLGGRLDAPYPLRRPPACPFPKNNTHDVKPPRYTAHD